MKFAAVLMIGLALLIGIIPQFTDCESQGRHLVLENGREVPMKCHWTARAEMGLAAPLLGSGALMLVSRRKETRQNLSLIGALLGVFVILLPTALVGVCANPDMICNAIMRPTLILLGSLQVGLNLFVYLRARAGKEAPAWA